MPRIHVVESGECLTSIAWKYGFSDYQRIYDDPSNETFRERRPNPHLLHPGDVISIPDTPWPTYTLATGKRHVITIRTPKKILRVRLLDGDQEPLGALPYTLTAGKKTFEGTLTDEGILEHEIAANVHEAKLRVGGMTRLLKIGELNPMTNTADGGITGAQARLANLGYHPGAVDGQLGPRTRAAIEQFQTDQGLDVTGELDDALLAALQDSHGC
jgi:hypothetical protein